MHIGPPRHNPPPAQRRYRRRSARAVVLVGAFVLGIAACSSDDTGSSADTTTATIEVVARYAAADDPATRAATAEVLTRRLALAGYPAATARVDGQDVVVEAPATVVPFLSENLPALTRPGTVTFRPVMRVLAEGDEVGPDEQVVDGLDGTRYVLGPVALEGGVERSVAGAGAAGDAPVQVVFVEGADGIDAFNAAAGQCFDEAVLCPTGRLAVVVDDVVVNASEIEVPRFARDRVVLSGLDVDTARGLAVVLGSGPLPGPLTPA